MHKNSCDKEPGLKERLSLRSPKQNLLFPFAFIRRYLWIFTMKYLAKIPWFPWLRAVGRSASSRNAAALLPAQASQPALTQDVLSGCIIPCMWLQGLCVSKWPSNRGTDKPHLGTWPWLSVMLQRHPCKHSPLLLHSTPWAALTVQKNRTLPGTFNSQERCYWKPSFLKNLWNSQARNRCTFLKVLLLKG